MTGEGKNVLMTPSKDCVELVMKHEGLRLKAYTCPSGVATIGYGHTRGVKYGMSITLDDAAKFLAEDLQTAARAVDRFVLVPLTQPQFDALVSLVFNIGEGAFRSSTLVKHLNLGEYDDVPAQMRRWTKGTVNGVKKDLVGLVRRRDDEVALWQKEVPA